MGPDRPLGARTIAELERDGHSVTVVDAAGRTIHATRRKVRPALRAPRTLLSTDSGDDAA